jgi:hypothetical protein
LKKNYQDVLQEHNLTNDHKDKLIYDKDNFFKLINI